MRLKKYVFSYALDDRLYDPCNPAFYVRARNIRAARVKAQQMLASLIHQESREKWVWESSSFEQTDGKWVHYPAYPIGGRLLDHGHVVQPRRFYRFDKPLSFPVPPFPAGGAEALAAVISAPILDVIEQAPVFRDLFTFDPVCDASVSIPMRYCGKTVYKKPAAVRRPPI